MSIYDYDPDQKPKTSKEERDRLMKKFLEKGGKVQKLEPGYPKGVKGRAPKPDYDTYKKGSYHDFDVGGDNPPRWEKQPKNDMAGK